MLAMYRLVPNVGNVQVGAKCWPNPNQLQFILTLILCTPEVKILKSKCRNKIDNIENSPHSNHLTQKHLLHFEFFFSFRIYFVNYDLLKDKRSLTQYQRSFPRMSINAKFEWNLPTGS